MLREQTEWCLMNWLNTDVQDIPRILLVGDSIVAGHREQVAKRLEGQAVIGAYSTSKNVCDTAYIRELGLAIADYPIDIIYLNNGLHGFCYSDEDYRKSLNELIEFLIANTRARIYWRSSTPVTVRGDTTALRPERNDVVVRRNAIAEEVMRKHRIQTDDLYALMLGHPEYRSEDGFHYTEEGQRIQADHIADFLKRALAARTLEVNVNGYRTDYPGFVADWCGYECLNFTLEGIRCRLVKPNVQPDPRKHWYWRARFFGAFPDGDWAMLEQGWYVAHIDVTELYGSPESNRRFDLLYGFMTSLGFNETCVPVGYSRGGLDVLNWTAKNTDKVSCIYLDNPVCDFKSWPGGKGKADGDGESWLNCLKAWNFTEEQAMAYQHNPVDNLAALAAAKVPILILCGDADEVVPPEENALLLQQRYQASGAPVEVIHKPGAKHHPHCLENPQKIVDFLMRYSR